MPAGSLVRASKRFGAVACACGNGFLL